MPVVASDVTDARGVEDDVRRRVFLFYAILI
jgi:hypothetical protein